MGGLSNTYVGSGVVRLDAYRCRASGTNEPPAVGQILSDTAHPRIDQLRYFEVEFESVNETAGRRLISIGLRGATTELDTTPGVGTAQAVLDGISDLGGLSIFQSGSPIVNYQASRGLQVIGAGKLYRFWVHLQTGKVWVTNEAQPQQATAAFRPDLGTGPLWTMAETSGDIRIALGPAYGSTPPNTNVIRLRSRHQDLLCKPLYGAIPWDAQSVTIVSTVSGVANGTTLRWAWFDEARPDLMTIAPTSTGTVTVISGQVSVLVSTSLDPGGVGSLLLSNTNGAVVQCRSHYAPEVVP